MCRCAVMGPAWAGKVQGTSSILALGTDGGADAGPLCFAEQTQGDHLAQHPSQPWPDKGAEGASTRTRQTSGDISSGYSPRFQNMQLKTSYARGSGFKFNSPWWISLPWTHPVTSLADVTSLHPHPVVRSSLTTPCEEPSPFVSILANCLLHLVPSAAVAVISHSWLAFSMLCLILQMLVASLYQHYQSWDKSHSVSLTAFTMYLQTFSLAIIHLWCEGINSTGPWRYGTLQLLQWNNEDSFLLFSIL